ncbi:ABC transporter permease [Sphaerisporangium sp. TRM90804]|uniref:ABC transporter permease n=1 Tax=Sphaerisporangium sp. TRM90804 TaxID=3031113 RepID=UPI0024483ABC|nr:ABC transporter permease [Sphaerisporangium sp. TRM90804]MDH2426122.1 ABC transporter permease [Sphaerisporangium sp. TRM90804]
MRGVLSSEWLKLRSVRSTTYTLSAAALTVVLAGVYVYYAGTVWDGRDPAGRAAFRATAPEVGFLPLLQVSLAVLGVLAITPEYATGMIRTSLAAVPRRGVLLLAKAGVVAGVTLTAALAILFATYAVGRLVAGDRAMDFNTGSLGGDLPLLLGSAVSVTVLALIGLGVGTVTRSTVGGVVAVAAVLFVLPIMVTFVPAPWSTRAASLLPADLVRQIAGQELSMRLGEGMLSPVGALAVLVGYGAVAVAAGAAALHRRDA